MAIISHQPHGATSTLVYVEACVAARDISIDALTAYMETLASIVDDPEADTFERFNAAERLRGFTEELARRERVARLRTREASRYDRDHETWTQLAALVKTRVSVTEVLQLGGIVVTRTGISRRSGATEYHSACPVCRDGVDRLVSWDGPNGRVWCRRCEWSANVIAVTQSLIRGCDHFRDAVRFLAALASMEANDGR